jgi:hypothetical protein
MFNSSIFPSLSALPLAGKPMQPRTPTGRSPTLSRRELRRLIAHMID